MFAAPASSAALPCSDISIVGFAGSGEQDDVTQAQATGNMGPTIRDFYDRVKQTYSGSGTAVTGYGVIYPDPAVAEYWNNAPVYLDSVTKGVAAGLRYISGRCKTEKLVLAGFSQGADVAQLLYDSLSSSVRKRVVGLIQFGDPHFNPNIHPVDQGDYGNFSGILGPRSVDTHANFTDIGRSYCVAGDPICNFNLFKLADLPCLNTTDNLYCPHLGYRENGMTLLAALFVKSRVAPVMNVPAGTLWAWGFGGEGMLGNGGTASSPVPGVVSNLSDVRNVASGHYASYALTGDGSVWAWGDGLNGELGNGVSTGVTTLPIKVTALSKVTAIASGGYSAFALLADGTVRAWGYGADGQLGNATAPQNSATPVTVSGLNSVIALAGGAENGYALLSDGTVRAWGRGDVGQLGNGSPTNSSVPVKVPSLSNVTALSAGGASAFALLKDGTVRAWGNGALGNLGNGTDANSLTPVQVSGLTDVIAIASGAGTGYALKRNGTVWAWGFGADGELGNGTRENSAIPVLVSTISGATSIAAGNRTAFALRSGTVWAWGQNGPGALGNGTIINDATIPVQVSGLSKITKIASSANGNGNGYAITGK
jgi:alpha-tubulin suppressor-like RCC1 family protein